jgi:hypothetical protein
VNIIAGESEIFECISTGRWDNIIRKPLYKVYSALLSQSGSNPDSHPVATVLENTIGDIVWTRDFEGGYSGTLIGAFPQAKTILLMQYDNFAVANDFVDIPLETIIYQISDNAIQIETTSNNLYSDSVMLNKSVEIRVYNFEPIT